MAFENAYRRSFRRNETACGVRASVGDRAGSSVHGRTFSRAGCADGETLRGELLELWHGRKIPTRAIFIVTHNIEERVVLADRVIVAGEQPGEDPRGF